MKILLVGVLAIVGGVLGAYLFQVRNPSFGATTARTTITNQWTFSATTTAANLVVTTTNTATSSAQVGCIQTTATSTATPIALFLGSINASATSTFQTVGVGSTGFVGWMFGKCPKV